MFDRLILIFSMFFVAIVLLVTLPKIFLRGTEKAGELFEVVTKKISAALLIATRELVILARKVDAWLKSTIQFVTKNFWGILPWTVAAFVALTVGFFALGRQFFCADNAKSYVEKFLPPREFERKTLSLTLIELMIVLHEKILERVNHASRS